jgi:hypothetical protein
MDVSKVVVLVVAMTVVVDLTAALTLAAIQLPFIALLKVVLLDKVDTVV